jgi:type I restriction enzyme, S subunit
MDDSTAAQRDSSLIPQPSYLSTRRFRPYPDYQSSGAEWIGEIPSHWSTKRLKTLVHFQGGGTPSKENLEYWTGNIPWVSPKDMKTQLILDTADKITVEAVEESATNLVEPGAVLLVVRSGILNHTIPVAIAGTTVALNQDLKALIPGSEILPKYLSYVIDGKQSSLLVEWRKEGATVESLEMDLIKNSHFPLPPESEQHAIAEFLDRETSKIDVLVAKKERLIDLLQEQRTALITRAVTKGLDLDVPTKDSGVEWLGEIPVHWKIIHLK